MCHGIAQRSDAELQCSAVRDEARNMHAGRVVGGRNLLVWYAKEWKLIFIAFEYEIEPFGVEFRVAEHVREITIDLADYGDCLTRTSACFESW